MALSACQPSHIEYAITREKFRAPCPGMDGGLPICTLQSGRSDQANSCGVQLQFFAVSNDNGHSFLTCVYRLKLQLG